MAADTPVVAVVGVTGAGKTRVAVTLAARFGGEIVCADSRTIHRELTIGASKPTADEQAAAAHHLLDVVDVDGTLTAPAFGQLASAAIDGIAARERLPLVAGGSRRYVEEVLFELEPLPLGTGERAALERADIAGIHAAYATSGTALPLNHLDRNALISYLDGNRCGRRLRERRPGSVIVGVTLPLSRADYIAATRRRVTAMVAEGLIEEVRGICERHGRDAASLFSIGYAEWQPYFDGTATVADCIEAIVDMCVRYADGQRRWLDGLAGLVWVRDADEAAAVVAASGLAAAA